MTTISDSDEKSARTCSRWQRWVEPWYLVYALLGATAVGLIPVLLPLTLSRTGSAIHIGLVMAALRLGGLTAPLGWLGGSLSLTPLAVGWRTIGHHGKLDRLFPHQSSDRLAGSGGAPQYKSTQTVTLASDGQTITLRVGEQFLLKLGDDYD